MDRNEIVARYAAIAEQIEELEIAGSRDGIDALRTERFALGEAYRNWLPRMPVSRCPFTAEVLRHSFDAQGLDGMWWSYFDTVRPLEDVPPTFFTLQGALRVSLPVEPTPFLCSPGPGVPYVIPRLLHDNAMRAVLSSFSVGKHIAYLITYFGKPLPRVRRVNTWARQGFELRDADGNYQWGEAIESPATFDYHLPPWIERGKLAWIAPGDETLTFRSTTADCPYVGLQGTRALQHLEAGNVWT
jgi:hypothetical protein